MATNGPKRYHQLCFNADPNDLGAVPLWVDYTHLVRKIGQNRRGAQYELAQSMAAQPRFTWRDPDEILNPANTSSPQHPNVQPYRQVLSQAVYPNDEAGNLLNSGSWKANNAVAPDPSFESYANGAALPSWLTAVGAVTATVTTTNPQQGTKSLTYTVAGTADRQGISWDVDCVPGRQYTTSAYVRQSSASTQRLLVGGQTLAYDNFERTSSNGWGTADLGGAWSTSGGSASDYSVGSGTGKHSIGTLNARRFTVLGSTFADVDEVISITVPSVITGGVGDFVIGGLVGRYTDADNHYRAEVNFQTENTFALEISKRVAAVTTSLDVFNTNSDLYAAGDTINLRLQISATTIRARMWAADRVEPTTWDVEATDSAISGLGGIGGVTFASSGVTNTLPVVMAFDGLMMTGATASTTTTTTGTYVRLTQTFIATQPLHAITVATLGTAVAGTVNLDAFQHEIGASASAFATTGAVIYPYLRDYIERWPREYEAAGFVGKSVSPAVDGFAALNAISIDPDYVVAVLESNPDYYWRLDGGAGTLQALETSGNNGPALSQYDSKYGPGVAPAFGTQIGVPGDAGATGVRFTPTSPGGVNQPDSILSLGRTPATPGILFPRVYGTSAWGASAACWVQLTDNGANQQILAPLAGNFTSPVGIVATSGGSVAVAAQSPASGSVSTTASAALADGEPHLIVGTATQVNGGNTTVSIYVDGIFIDDTAVSTASLGGMFTAPATFLNVGGSATGGSVVDGVVTHVSLWQRALTADEITTLYEAGGLGYAGETTSERLERHMGSGRYAGAKRISPGFTTLQAATWTNSIDLLTDAQQLTLAELGRFWMAPDGAAVFESRQDRWLRLTSIGTFGEDTASGETPYLDGIMFDYDPMFVYADVRITRNNGAVARGGTAADINIASRKYFPRSYAIGADFETDIQAQYYADWVFNSHKAPLMRVAALTIDPSSNPALWPVALSREVGQRVTVKRRAKAANGGVGLTMSAEYFIEAVIWSEWDADKQSQTVGFLLSPIGLAPDEPTFQPWILEHATYGVLDETTVLGW